MIEDKSPTVKKSSWNLRRVTITVFKFAVSVGILAYLFGQAWQNDHFATIAAARKDYFWLALAVFAGMFGCVIAFFRWHQLVIALELPFRLSDAVRLGFLGHLFNLMSFGVFGGDAIKAMFVARQMRGRVPEVFASVFADRVIGLSAMLMFASVGYLLSDFSQLEAVNPTALASVDVVCRFSILISVLMIAIMFGLNIFEGWQKSYLAQKFVAIPRVGNIVGRLFQVISIYRTKKSVIFWAYVMSFASVAMFAVAIYSLARGLSDSYPSFVSHFVIAPIAMVANAAPLPGGLGGMELALDFLYRGFSQKEIPSEHGFVVALGFRLILLAVAAVGILVYLTKKREINTLKYAVDQSIA
ncbi:MAG TPA: lysylphosphatidylglycerol synthase transmembrane domain-containing protein [Pirellulaceae bacterium]|nr:lysylphosphatidylglycerol synthase transmembrane domain-containing protein [Pirellulaceae bacterium]HMO94124.1 lysylphosphatidylglycerol synthase transmembrane domain-containing protein [Pirellulaceae bacterium]HMP70840.1 lysylphosphatidylglycerol synthase transmembrane domain-containing protein [Pirellulaceae bacterium]